MHGRVLSVNVGRPAPLVTRRGIVASAIDKSPVDGPVAARGHSLAGDEQADRVNHGGPDQAVYAYAIEDVRHFAAELGRPLGPGFFGENLTLEGVDASHARIGERWRIGTVELVVTCPRIPCSKLGVRMGDLRWVRRFARAGLPGCYLAIAREGELAAGDRVEVLERPDHGVDVALMLEAVVVDRSLLPRLEPARASFTPGTAAFLAGLDAFELDG